MVVDPYKTRKRYTLTESLDLIVSVKYRNPIRLKLKCDWWCSYFDTTDGYLRFIPTDGQTTVPFFPVMI